MLTTLTWIRAELYNIRHCIVLSLCIWDTWKLFYASINIPAVLWTCWPVGDMRNVYKKGIRLVNRWTNVYNGRVLTFSFNLSGWVLDWVSIFQFIGRTCMYVLNCIMISGEMVFNIWAMRLSPIFNEEHPPNGEN